MTLRDTLPAAMIAAACAVAASAAGSPPPRATCNASAAAPSRAACSTIQVRRPGPGASAAVRDDTNNANAGTTPSR